MSRTIKKPYRKSRVFDKTCRSHGSCPYCTKGRLHKFKKKQLLEKEVKAIIDEADQCDI